jgi:hypothetical protein
VAGGERNLVVSSQVVSPYPDHIYFDQPGSLNPQQLRFWLLFWDKLDFPANDLISFSLDAEGQFLQSAGVLNRTTVPTVNTGLGSVDPAADYVRTHIAAFRLLDEKEPGVWSLATGKDAISFPNEDLEVDRGLVVSLHRAMPIPDKDVPLQDVLEFRTKRHDELIALRHHLEEIYQRILTAGDGELAINTELERLQLAISDHIKASRETGFKFRLADFEAGFNKLVPGAATFFAGYAAGLTVLQALIPAAAAMLDIKVGPSLKRHKATATPFRYISSYHRELF